MPIYSNSTIAEQPIIPMPWKEIQEAGAGMQKQFDQGRIETANLDAEAGKLYSPIAKDNEQLKQYQQEQHNNVEQFRNVNWLDPQVRDKFQKILATARQDYSENGKIGQLLKSKELALQDYKETMANKSDGWDDETKNNYFNKLFSHPELGHDTNKLGIYKPHGLPPKPDYLKTIDDIQNKVTPDIKQGNLELYKTLNGTEVDKINKVKELSYNKLFNSSLEELDSDSKIKRAADFEGNINNTNISGQIYKKDQFGNPLVSNGKKIPNYDNKLVQMAAAKAHSRAYLEDLSEYRDIHVDKEHKGNAGDNYDVIATKSSFETNHPIAKLLGIKGKNLDIYTVRNIKTNPKIVPLLDETGQQVNVEYPSWVHDKTDDKWYISGNVHEGKKLVGYADPSKQPDEEGYFSALPTGTNLKPIYDNSKTETKLFNIDKNAGRMKTYHDNYDPRTQINEGYLKEKPGKQTTSHLNPTAEEYSKLKSGETFYYDGKPFIKK